MEKGATINQVVVVEYDTLEAEGINRVINHGKNEFGFNERTIIMEDGREFEYIPEDNLYELIK